MYVVDDGDGDFWVICDMIQHESGTAANIARGNRFISLPSLLLLSRAYNTQ